MEAKRNRVSALLDAQMTHRDIATIVPCSVGFVSKVKNLKDNSKDLSRKPGSGGHNKKRTTEFLGDLANAIEAAPTTSMRSHAKNLDVSRETVRNAVKDLGAVERKACATPHANVDALKAAVEKEWAEMSVEFVVKSCRAFRPRIEAMIEAEGGHFEM